MVKTTLKTRKNGRVEKFYSSTCPTCLKDKGYVRRSRIDLMCLQCSGKLIGSLNAGKIGPNLGKQFSDDTCLKMSKSKIGTVPWNKGKKEVRHEVRLKQALAKVGKIPWNKGTKNLNADDVNKRKFRHLVRRYLKGALSTLWFESLVCMSQENLRAYFESKFIAGMSWDNYGKWHIDHIVPLSSFNLLDPEQVKVACHYTNLQPLWAKDNLKKGSKKELIIVTGAPASGKSWVVSQLSNYDVIDSDVVRKKDLVSRCEAASKPVLTLTVGVSTFIKRNPQFSVKLVVIQEDEQVINNRMLGRNGRVTGTIKRRIKRMLSLAKQAVFSGTADEVLKYLK